MSRVEKFAKTVLEPAFEAWEEEIVAPFRQEAIDLRKTVTELRQENASLQFQLENASRWLTQGN
ncbi:hypothetical protein M0R72_12790 [Candidatus Pacearchaeota archaeon]|jgi:hypothetical protein|nr:hypothetical protein [Candidatus Pacearchaeota archaeon]